MPNNNVLQKIPIANGSLFGGDAIVIEDYQDLAAIRALCATRATIGTLGDAIRVSEVRLGFPDLRALWHHDGRRFSDELHARTADRDPDELDELDKLSLALEMADELWRREPPGKNGTHDNLAFIFAVGDPGQEMEFESEEPAFGLTSGSILSFLTRAGMAPVKAVGWLLAFVRGQGMTTSAIAGSLADELRVQRFLELTPSDVSRRLALPDLNDKTVKAPQDGRSIVFVHGLLSTDLGTFDGFIQELHARHPLVAASISFFGWPHDTLTGIADNARNLAELVHARIGTRQRFAFVCHSRGGLVARATALLLYGIDPAYRTSLKGCVTFGTPHDGADMAQASSGDFLAYFVAVGVAASTRSLSLLSDILRYQRQQKDHVIQGIEDLRPPNSDGFIASLRSDELADPMKPSGRVRYMQLTAVGGDYSQAQGKIASVARRFFGPGVRHDLVVALDSSIPTWADTGVSVDCAHSDYCSEALRPSKGMDAAITSTVGWLQ